MATYVAITPARNEAQNLLRLAPCMIEQTLPPAQWIIVDNGSTDDTLAIARKLADENAWIVVAQADGEAVETRGAPVVRAFHAGSSGSKAGRTSS
jgi:biofilm PGA synthesis N-glycosyltransferase PgaC